MPATLSQYYLDAKNFPLSTSVFTDAALTTVAAQGWYSDGVIYRFLTVSGVEAVLGPATTCPTCFSECSGEININTMNVSGGTPADRKGTYLVPLGTGVGPETLGAIIVRIYYKETAATGESEPMGLLAWGETEGTAIYTTNTFSGTGTVSGAIINPVEGEVSMGYADGGDLRIINDTDLTSDVLPLWVGSNTNTSQDANNACAAGIPQLPSNNPFAGIGAPATITRAGYPQYTYSYGTANFQLDAATPDIIVEQQQVQAGMAASPNDGYRGWYTTVIPKDDIQMDKVWVKIQNVMCNAAAYVRIKCAEKLVGIPCSPPASTQQEACSSPVYDNNNLPMNTVYNVPGATGYMQGTWAFENQMGLPNRWDIACSTENGTQLPATGKEKWYKYINSNGESRLFYVNIHGIITETNVECLINPIALSSNFQVQETLAGGGVYTAQADIPIASSGAVIVRMLTGNTPKGLFITHLDADDTVIGKCNTFSVRGSNNDENNLMQDQYELISDSANVISITGYNTAGASARMGGFNTQTGWVPFEDSGLGNILEWEVYDYDIGCGTSGPNDNSINCYMPILDGVPTAQSGNCDYEPGSCYFGIDAPVYIGKAGDNSAAYPCTFMNMEFAIPAVDCANTFNPPQAGGGDPNVTGIINLPSNGNHLYNSDFVNTVPPALNGAESMMMNISYPSGSYEGFGDDIFLTSKYPYDSTGCNSCQYPARLLDGTTGLFENTGTSSMIWVNPPQVQLYSTDDNNKGPGWSMAVIPLDGPTTVVEKIRVSIYSLTANTEFIGQIEAPGALPALVGGMYLSTGNNTIAVMCAAGAGAGPLIPVYVAHNAFGGTQGPCVPGTASAVPVCSTAGAMAVDRPYLNDMLFTDSNGATPLGAGVYFFSTGGANDFSVAVDDYGVVTCIKQCVTLPACVL